MQLNSYEVQHLKQNNTLVKRYYEKNGIKIFQNESLTTTQDSDFLSYFISFDKINSFTFYESGWGKEFIRKKENIENELILINDHGRSSKYGNFFIVNGEKLIAIAYSGNYFIKVTKKHIEIVLENKEFNTYNARKYSPLIIMCDNSEKFYEFAYENCPKNSLQESMMVEFNHWWAYEDYLLNEDNFYRNSKIFKELGGEVVVLDAGWFGDESNWFDIRGDWDIENLERFPNGIKGIANKIHDLGLKFGIWIEPEGLGENATITATKNFQAVYNNENLGYVCLGTQEGYNFVYSQFVNIIEKTNCDWVKIDFNLDPKLGCNCVEHDHGPTDGLYQHYMNLYDILDKISVLYPHIVLENCSSGGLRLDYGMFLHTHVSFQSDHDYVECHDRCYNELTNFFPPSRILHFMWSETCNEDANKRPFPRMPINDKIMDEGEIRYYIRKAFLHYFGISHRLELYNDSVKHIMTDEITRYKGIYREFIKQNNFKKELDNLNRYIFKSNNDVLVFEFNDTEEVIESLKPKNSRIYLNNKRIDNKKLEEIIMNGEK